MLPGEAGAVKGRRSDGICSGPRPLRAPFIAPTTCPRSRLIWSVSELNYDACRIGALINSPR